MERARWEYEWGVVGDREAVRVLRREKVGTEIGQKSACSAAVRPGNTTVEYGNLVEGLGAGTSYVHRWHEWIVIYRLAAKQQNASYYPSPTT